MKHLAFLLQPPALPPAARHAALRSLLDLCAVWASGRQTALSRLIHEHARAHFAAGAATAPLGFDGRPVSPAGAALAGGMTIDAMDAHDGYREAKGHAGCGLLPALTSAWLAESLDFDPDLFLQRLVAGYEIGCRLGAFQHRTLPDYHSSGSWVAVAVAGMLAPLLGCDAGRLAHALGIAEYHGPRAPMMRLIDHPTMLKDSSGWGSMAGVCAAYLARDGFTGGPAELPRQAEATGVFDDLGRTWLIEAQYFKPWPVCRWAQPAVQAALQVRERVGARRIAALEVFTFREAVRLAGAAPATTEEAQYAIAFPVACALLHGDIAPHHVDGGGLRDADVLALAERLRLSPDPACEAAFPGRRKARLVARLITGEVLETDYVEAAGDPERPLDDADLEAKARRFVEPALGAVAAEALVAQVDLSRDRLDLAGLLALLASGGAAPCAAAVAE